MTQVEAANILWWASKRHYPGDQMDITAEDIEAFDMAIAALCGAQPDPATGLEGCLFCKAMDDYKALQIDPPFAYEYTAAIVSRLYKAGNPRARSTSTYYGNGKYVLNFCPMCGRKLEVEG